VAQLALSYPKQKQQRAHLSYLNIIELYRYLVSENQIYSIFVNVNQPRAGLLESLRQRAADEGALFLEMRFARQKDVASHREMTNERLRTALDAPNQ
jgi:hypothetical protein